MYFRILGRFHVACYLLVNETAADARLIDRPAVTDLVPHAIPGITEKQRSLPKIHVAMLQPMPQESATGSHVMGIGRLATQSACRFQRPGCYQQATRGASTVSVAAPALFVCLEALPKYTCHCLS